MPSEREVKTTLTLEAKTKGFEGAQKRAEKLRDAISTPTLSESFKKFEKHLVGAEKAFDKINTHLSRMTRLFGRLERSMDVLTKGMRRTAGGIGGAAPAPGGPSGSGTPPGTPPPPAPPGSPGAGTPRDRQPGRQPSFLQGLLQGVGLGEYIPRKEGVVPMLRQAAGRMTGSVLRGAMSAPFTGLQGITTGLQAIPGGGILAGQLQTAMSNAQGALEQQRRELSLAPMMDFRRMGAAERMGARGVESDLASEISMAQAKRGRARELSLLARRETVGTVPGVLGGTEIPLTRTGETARNLPSVSAKVLGLEHAADAMNQAAAALEQKAEPDTRRVRIRKARSIARDRAAFGNAIPLGQELMGAGRPEALEFAGQLVRTGGGSFTGAAAQDAIRSAMAARTAFGVEAGTSGAFLRAGREGGLVGGGLAGDRLAETIGDAMRMGLEGSEIHDFLEETASALQEFKTTGMPVNPRSISELGQQMATGGLGVMRGGAVSGQITRAAQRVSAEGPKNAAEFQLLQTMGGFQGGGLEQLEDAMSALQTGDFKGPGFNEFIKRSIGAGGGGAGGRFALRRAFGQLGANLNIDESRLLERVSRGETLEGKDAERLALVQGRLREGREGAPRGVEGLENRAKMIMENMGGALREQASLENERLAIGKKFIGTMNNLERTTLEVQGAFSKFSPEVTTATRLLKDFSSGIPSLADALRGAFGLDTARVQPGAGGR